MKYKQALITIFLSSLVLSSGSVAFARQAAVVNFKSDNPVPKPMMARLQETLHEGLSAHLETLSLADTMSQLKDKHPELVECRDAECLQKMGKILRVPMLVEVELVMESSLYMVTINVAETVEGTQKLSVADECMICTLDEAASMFKQLADILGKQMVEALPDLDWKEDSLVSVHVQSSPEGAKLVVDNQDMGITNLSFDVPPGNLTFQLQKDGYETISQSIIVPEEQDELQLVFNLKQLRIKSDERVGKGAGSHGDVHPSLIVPDEFKIQEEPFPVIPIAIGGVGAGLASVALGAILLRMDGNQTCPQGPLEACSTIYDTRQAGLAAVGFGGVLVLGAATIFFLMMD